MVGEELAGDAAYLRGKACPKCAYMRTPADTGPEWLCPKCHVAYAKAEMALSTAMPVVTIFRDPEDAGTFDSSLFVLLAANVLVVALAVLFGMSARGLVLVYLAQGVLIGLANVVRVVNLRRFQFQGNRDAPEPDPDPEFSSWLKLLFVIGLIIFYLGLHAAIFSTVMRDVEFYPGVPDDFGVGFWLCTLVFACTHFYSLWHNIRADCRGAPSMEAIAMIPYFRALPILISPIAALGAPGNVAAIIFFATFKTLADCYMHRVTHAFMRHVHRPLVG